MNAIVCTKYGSPNVLQLREVAKPAPQDEEVLIKIHAASINSHDWRMMRANPFFIRLIPGGFLQLKTRSSGLTWPSVLRWLAEKSDSLSQAMRSLGTCRVPPVVARLPSMSVPRNILLE